MATGIKVRTGIKVQLQWHQARKQYCKVIGLARGREGSVKKKLWYLGEDQDAAVKRYFDLKSQWKALRDDGKHLWDDSPFIGRHAPAGLQTLAKARETRACGLKTRWGNTVTNSGSGIRPVSVHSNTTPANAKG